LWSKRFQIAQEFVARSPAKRRRTAISKTLSRIPGCKHSRQRRGVRRHVAALELADMLAAPKCNGGGSASLKAQSSLRTPKRRVSRVLGQRFSSAHNFSIPIDATHRISKNGFPTIQMSHAIRPTTVAGPPQKSGC
jgi:ribosomal protein L32